LGRYENPVVVLGGGLTGLGVERNFGRNGIDVYLVLEKKDIALYSKYCNRYFVVPKISRDRKKLKAFLTKFKRRLNYPAVVFPTSDNFAQNLSDIREEKEVDSYYFSIPPKDALETFVEKKRFYKSLTSKGVPHPKTFFEVDEIREINEELSYPIFLKPSVSQIFFGLFQKKGFVAATEKDVIRYWTLAKRFKIDMMIQEIIPGPPTNHIFIDGYMDRNSTLKAIFARRRLRMWPLSFGNSTVCESISLSEVADIKEKIVGYLHSIDYSGIFSAEFKKDERDNLYKLLEINARSWWYNSFPTSCGINILFMAYLDAIGKDFDYVEDYEIGVKLIYLMDDLKSSIALLTQNKLNPRERASCLVGKRDWAVLAKDDLRPWLMSFAHTPFRGRKRQVHGA
jgi:predicted ATP-grasp superfamily ATP-dependent carboligase